MGLNFHIFDEGSMATPFDSRMLPVAFASASVFPPTPGSHWLDEGSKQNDQQGCRDFVPS
jgi:hypothetical protein